MSVSVAPLQFGAMMQRLEEDARPPSKHTVCPYTLKRTPSHEGGFPD